ncbi:MAG: hypothetical protein O3B73_12835 [bacterium]|nr:hypothetical protein [bacterium]
MTLFEEPVSEGKSVIVVTHDQDIAQRAHRIIRIRGGVIEEDRRQGCLTSISL